MKHDRALSAAVSSLGIDLPDASIERLSRFESLLVERAVPLGLVSGSDRELMRERHLLDCLRAAPLVPSGTVVDVGSGAGLPGIVVAIARPDTIVHLSEPRRRRLSFLELAVERLDLDNAVPMGTRVEDLETGYDGALARAFAPPEVTWAAALRLLQPGGRLIYFAGARLDLGDLEAEHVGVEIVPPPALLASAGPLVIMTRQ